MPDGIPKPEEVLMSMDNNVAKPIKEGLVALGRSIEQASKTIAMAIEKSNKEKSNG